MCEGFLGLKVMWVMGESLSSQALCSPLFCTMRLQAVYCFSGMLNSNSWRGETRWLVRSGPPRHHPHASTQAAPAPAGL